MFSQNERLKQEALLYFDEPECFRVMNQTGVKQCVLPSPSVHNASWDAFLTDNGELYLSLCSELTTSEYAKLAKYHYDENRVEELFYTKELIFPNERFIRDSKIHTSMAQMNDGRFIMLTHTTDKAPEHPAWMPNAYYNHPWEGYPGSSLITYDPETKQAENWGIPVHRETLYGGTYDKVKNAYYALGYLKGHLYRIDLDNRQVKDYGQVVERASYRLVVGSDQNIYFTTRNGVLMRINVETQEVENLKHTLPNGSETKNQNRSYMTYAVNGPDGKLYIAGMFHDELSVYDPETNQFQVLGRYKNTDQVWAGIDQLYYIGAMDFDAEGVLYYVLCCLREDGGEDYRLGNPLMRWDIKKGGEPEYLGLAGTEERVVTSTCSLFIDQEKNLLYIISTNHGNDAPDIIAVDLAIYKDKAGELGPITKDAHIDPENTQYEEHGRSIRETRRLWEENPYLFSAQSVIPIALWEHFADDEIQESAVRSLEWNGNTLDVWTGKDLTHQFRINCNGEILEKTVVACFEKTQTYNTEELDLPFYPGRQYKAVVDKMIEINGKRKLIATKDGMLAIWNGNHLFSLGPAWVNGPVNDWTVTKDGKKVYGVAGDPDDFSVVFEYSDEKGLRILGSVATDGHQYGSFNSPYLTSIALNADDTILAIGSGERLGSVYLYYLTEK